MSYSKFECLIVVAWLMNSCVHGEKTEPGLSTMPDWVNEDCKLSGGHYYFVGFGKGGDASSAMRAALVSSRQNALACVFGGTISANVELKESNQNIEFTSVTSIDLSYEHVNWAGYEQVPARIFFPKSEDHQVYSQYRWKVSQITTEQDRLKSLARKIEENRALKKEVEASQKIAEEKEALLKAQKAELDRLKRHEQEIVNLKSKKEKVLAELDKLKKQRKEKGKEFVDMVTRMGCDVTYDDLVKLIGKPDDIKVRGICYEACKYDLISKWVPVLVYRYGSYGIKAYVSGATMTGSSDWSEYKKYKSDAQIVDIWKVKGSRQGWWVCEDGYSFVRRLTRS